MRPNTAESFWSRIDRSNPGACWPWPGGKSSRGYGTVSWGNRNVGAHRVAYELAHGLIPAGMFVCHRCDNPPCCNPAHLFLGAPKDNTQDMVSKQRYSTKGGLVSRKLSDEQVREIRAKYRPRSYSFHRLAAEYGIAAMGVRKIVLRETYTEVE